MSKSSFVLILWMKYVQGLDEMRLYTNLKEK